MVEYSPKFLASEKKSHHCSYVRLTVNQKELAISKCFVRKVEQIKLNALRGEFCFHNAPLIVCLILKLSFVTGSS